MGVFVYVGLTECVCVYVCVRVCVRVCLVPAYVHVSERGRKVCMNARAH